jgi:uncharacterized protein
VVVLPTRGLGNVGDVGTRLQEVEAHREEIMDLVRRHHGRSIAVFGSVSRGDDGPDSDVDFLVDFEAGSSLFDLGHLQDDLEALLGCKVDVVSVGGLKSRDSHIRAEATPL